MINEKNNIGNIIRYFRELKHLSQAKLAEQIGVSQRNVSYYESGDHIPPADVLKKLASIFGITVDELVGTKKINSHESCEDYFYEEGLVNWNIRKKATELGLTYEDVLSKTCIDEHRFDLLWFGNAQPFAEELIRFAEVLDISIDYLLDYSQRENISSNEELILSYYKKNPEDVMALLSSFCTLSKKERTIILGKCFELEHKSSVAADEPLKKTGTDNPGK